MMTPSAGAYLLVLLSVVAQNAATVQRERVVAEVQPALERAAETPAEVTFHTYYVDPSGSDQNDGLTEARPFRTLQKAADSTEPGDTVLIMNGTYAAADAAADVLKITRSGRPDRWITYRNYPGARPLIFNERSWQGINIYGASYIAIDGLTVKGNGASITQQMADEASHMESATNGNCILAQKTGEQYPHHITFINNIVYDCPGGGIGTTYADYIRIDGNVVVSSALWSKWGNSGISIYESRDFDDGEVYRNIITNNLSCGNGQRIATKGQHRITDGNGIIIDDSNNTQSNSVPYTGRTLVANNTVYDNGGRGIHVYHSSHVDIVENLVFMNNQILKEDGEISVVFSDDVKVVGNVAYAQQGQSAMHVYGNQVVRMINNRLHDEGLERSQILNSLKARPSLDGMRRASRSGAGAALWQQELFDGERCEPAVVAN